MMMGSSSNGAGDSIKVNIILGIIKTIICLYDIITLPIYFLAQRPWKKSFRSKEPRATGDPLIGWTRKPVQYDHLLFQVTTLDELTRGNAKKYGDQKMLASREVFGEEDEKQPDGKVFRKFILGDYKWYTFNQIDERIEHIAKGLMLNGIKPGDVVMIFAETRMEWYLAAQAIFRLGGTIGTLYATLGTDAIIHGLQETQVEHLITTSDLLPKVKNLLAETPRLKNIIYIDIGCKKASVDGFPIQATSFVKIEEMGQNSNAGAKFIPPQAEDTAIIMYTSGSTGVPKGVMISHKNVLSTMKGFYAVANSVQDTDAVYMSFLPLAHVLELAAETFFLSVGCSIGYSSPHTMTDVSTGIKKGCQGDATILKPKIMASVPLVLDRIRKGVDEKVSSRGELAKAFFDFGMEYKTYWRKQGFSTPIIDFLACRKSRALLGGNLDYIVCGSAPLSPGTHDFIRSCLNLTLIQGYGLTETAAGSTLMDLDDLSVGRVGTPLQGITIKLMDWPEGNYHVTDKPYPRGEIVIGGNSVTPGYFKKDDITRESYRDEDGQRWFCTGDIGEVHPDGVFKIIDRKKDLVKLQYGEYISLGKVCIFF